MTSPASASTQSLRYRAGNNVPPTPERTRFTDAASPPGSPRKYELDRWRTDVQFAGSLPSPQMADGRALDPGGLITRRHERALVASIEQPDLQFDRPTDAHEVARDCQVDLGTAGRRGGRPALKPRESFREAACQPFAYGFRLRQFGDACRVEAVQGEAHDAPLHEKPRPVEDRHRNDDYTVGVRRPTTPQDRQTRPAARGVRRTPSPIERPLHRQMPGKCAREATPPDGCRELGRVVGQALVDS